MDSSDESARACARRAFLQACWLDVAVRKPGNVSLVSPGHGMQAQHFIASANAAAPALLDPGARVGARIEAAMTATWAAAGCNTNLGILLLCAPIALAWQRSPGVSGAAARRRALDQVLDELDIEDARATYRAIALANPGGLGRVQEQDVHAPPTLALRQAMALAAERDAIARQYASGYSDLFDLIRLSGIEQAAVAWPDPGAAPEPALHALVQRVYLRRLASALDSHLVRKHGEVVAHSVMVAAQAWLERALCGLALDQDSGFAAWDAALKDAGINPGTSADFTVAVLFTARLWACTH